MKLLILKPIPHYLTCTHQRHVTLICFCCAYAACLMIVVYSSGGNHADELQRRIAEHRVCHALSLVLTSMRLANIHPTNDRWVSICLFI
jgi:predicted deacylase